METAQQIIQALCSCLVLGVCFLTIMAIGMLIKTSQFEVEKRIYDKYIDRIKSTQDNDSKD
jgi:hypothetical protein